jgi:4'-phosphopantetheinyl transferase
MATSDILPCCRHHRIVTDGSPNPGKSVAASPLISPGSIDIWSALYEDLDRYYPYLSGLISTDETRKATGFKKPGDSRRYILRHGMVRSILGLCLDEAPDKLRFVQGTCGKPALDSGEKVPDLRFSLSHTDEMICIGITCGSAIGLDLVKPGNGHSFSAIGDYLFTPDERDRIAQRTADRPPVPDFRIWSLKEALIKAAGSDLRMMREIEAAGIMTDSLLNGHYTVRVGGMDRRFFICESVYQKQHHGTVAVIP